MVEFGVTRPHEHLVIDVRARVATQEPPEPLGGPWSALGDPRYGGAAAEYLLPQPVEPRWHGALAELEAEIRATRRRPRCARCAR